LQALNRHAKITTTTSRDDTTILPYYAEKLGLNEPTTSVEVFWEAYQKANWGKEVRAMDLIRACQNGDFGGRIFAPPESLLSPLATTTTTNQEAPPPLFVRSSPVVYLNSEAQRFIDIANERVEYNVVAPPKPKSPINNNKSSNNPLLDLNERTAARENGPATTTFGGNNNHNSLNPLQAMGLDRPLPIPIVHPRHQQGFGCMKCAGFIKRQPDGRPYGCRHTRVQTWSHKDILFYYSRMCEAFGGLHSGYTRYLFKDSLACTLAIKYKKRSRRAVYKKFKGIPEFPVPNDQRPRRFQIDQPIPYVHQCLRQRGSCTEIDMNDAEYLRGKFGFYGTKKLLNPAPKHWKPLRRRRRCKRPRRFQRSDTADAVPELEQQ